MPQEELEPDLERRTWSRRRQEIGAALWSSFLAACFGTMLFFAQFDPLTLILDERSLLRFTNAMTGYAMGFFFFWLIAAIAALLAIFLLKPAPESNGSSAAGRQSQ